MDPTSYEVLHVTRREDGTMAAELRLASGVTVIRDIASIEIEAVVHRSAESQTDGLPAREDLGVVSATYSNPAADIKARYAGLGTVEVPCE